MTKVHIVFGEDFASWVSHTLLNQGNHQHVVINIDDKLSYGPITHIDTEDGLMRRVAWFKDVLNESDYTKYREERKHQSKLLSQIRKGDLITIWRKNTIGDYLGTLYIATRLAEHAIKIIDVNEDVVDINQGLLEGMIENAQVVEKAKHHQLINEWLYWQNDRSELRVINDDGTMIPEQANAFDDDILNELNVKSLDQNELACAVADSKGRKYPLSFYQWRINKLIKQQFIQRSLDDEILSMQKGVL